MSTETTQGAAGAAEATAKAETAPELQNAGIAPPQVGEEGQTAESANAGEEEKLTPEQRTIRKLERRIDRLTAKRGGTERENELLRQDLEQARRQLQTAEGQQGEGDEGQGGGKRPLTEADVERLATQKAEELHRQKSIGGRVSKLLSEGSKIEGFDAAVDAVVKETSLRFADRQGKPTPFIEAVLECDAPAAVLKYLGDNPDDAEDFADLTPAQLGRRLARLEDQLKQSAMKKQSAAPKPLAPVNGANAGSEPDPSKMTDAQFNAWRRKQIDAKRGVTR